MKDIPLRILSIIEAPSAKTFRMKYYGKEEMPAFRAGQYFFASIGSGEEKTTLPCMISSAPATLEESNCLEITVPCRKDEPLGSYIHKNWRTGTVLTLSGPCGDFYYENARDGSDIVAIASGNGITPIRSMALDMIRTGGPQQMTILYGGENSEDLLFDTDLEFLAKRLKGRLKLHRLLTKEKRSGYESGSLTRNLFEKACGSLEGKTIFLSGTPKMTSVVRELLDELGVPETAIREQICTA